MYRPWSKHGVYVQTHLLWEMKIRPMNPWKQLQLIHSPLTDSMPCLPSERREEPKGLAPHFSLVPKPFVCAMALAIVHCTIWVGTKTKGHKWQRRSWTKVIDLDRWLYRIIWFWGMSNNGCWFGDPFPFFSTESTIGALHAQQSAVHCLSSKCGRKFLQNSLVFALLRAFCFCRFCSSVWIFRSLLYSMVGFKARLDHPK